MSNEIGPTPLRDRLPRFKSKRGSNGRCANCGEGIGKHSINGSRLCPGWKDIMDRAARKSSRKERGDE
jgi:hypothetical protein